MSKPFKSQFDLMAEAYGNVNYNKQKLINEDTAGKTVIGYPPSEDYEEPGPQLGGDLDPGEVDYDVTEAEDAEEAGPTHLEAEHRTKWSSQRDRI